MWMLLLLKIWSSTKHNKHITGGVYISGYFFMDEVATAFCC